jgi:hypothetical protein
MSPTLSCAARSTSSGDSSWPCAHGVLALRSSKPQLAAVLAVVAPKVAGLGLTRFPLGAALPDEFSAHGQQ